MIRGLEAYMYGAILGDIIGSPFEFDRGDKTKEFDLFSKGCRFTDDSVMTIAIGEDEIIKIEKIHGTVLLIGAEDDVLWDTAKYIRRMKQRMKEHSHTCRLDYVIYEHGTHFVFPESMLKTMLPVGSGLFVKLAFQAARKHPKECRRARLDIDQRVRNAVAEWKNRKETEKI